MPSFREVRQELKAIGIQIKRTDYDDFRVGNTERTAYYTDDLTDALSTGHVMSKTLQKGKTTKK